MSAKLYVPTFEMRHASEQPGFFARFVGGLRREWRIRSATESLSGFSDAQLRDLGIARSDIDRVVRQGR
jgi:uncharacterized protein YjiS (DUF1127 family)